MLDFIDFVVDCILVALLVIAVSGCCMTKTLSVEYNSPLNHKDEIGQGKIALSFTQK